MALLNASPHLCPKYGVTVESYWIGHTQQLDENTFATSSALQFFTGTFFWFALFCCKFEGITLKSWKKKSIFTAMAIMPLIYYDISLTQFYGV